MVRRRARNELAALAAAGGAGGGLCLAALASGAICALRMRYRRVLVYIW